MKNKIKFKKSDKMIIFGFIVYLLVVLAIFLPGYLNKMGTMYVMTNDYMFRYKNGKWYDTIDSKDYFLKEFDIYEKDTYKGKYKLQYLNKISLKDDNFKSVQYKNSILAYRGSFDFKYEIGEFNDEYEKTDDSIIEKALEKEDLLDSKNYSISQKLKIDVDNNGEEEIIYSIFNANSLSLEATDDEIEENNGKEYSLVFMYMNDKIYVIDKVLGSPYENTFDLMDVIDIRDDGKLELIYYKSPLQTYDSGCISIYNLGKKKMEHSFCK